MKRLAALHAWPLFSSRAATAESTVASRSSVLSRMNGSEPPSSSDDLLQVATRDLRDGGAGALGAGERDALDARVADDPLDLLVARVDVDVGVRREPGLLEDLLHRRRRLRALRRVLEQDRVADDQVGAGEARDLVVGVVPGHDPEQDADRAAAHERRALAVEEVDRLVGEQLLGVVGVELVDRGAELDLADRLLDRLAHLAHDDLAEPVLLLVVQLGHAPDQLRALLHRRRPRPRPVRRVRAADRVAQRVVRDRRVGLDRLPGRRVDHRILAHPLLLVRAPVIRIARLAERASLAHVHAQRDDLPRPEGDDDRAVAHLGRARRLLEQVRAERRPHRAGRARPSRCRGRRGARRAGARGPRRPRPASRSGARARPRP